MAGQAPQDGVVVELQEGAPMGVCVHGWASSARWCGRGISGKDILGDPQRWLGKLCMMMRSYNSGQGERV
eukprot:14800307-Heterocapsa_arctica.AAC.1